MTALLTWIGIAVTALGPAEGTSWWNAEVDASLDRLPARRDVWVKALEQCPPEQQKEMAYLIKYLPMRDLKSMDPKAMAGNVALAVQARREVPWGSGLPEPVFLDAVLPHASITEPREPMRREFHGRYLALVQKCQRPGEAAHELNKALFRDYKVSYNVKRSRVDQSSKGTIAEGKATCTGLSIMLVEACRAVSVPARLAGIAEWPGRGGNHTWVEIWDNGWHFVGAAEPDANGLDHAWFVGDAAKAIKGGGKNAIYAVTYRRTGDVFPMGWSGSAKIPGEEVTDRYARKELAKAPSVPKLMVEVLRKGERVEAEVVTIDRTSGSCRPLGTSFGPTIDINRRLTCEAPPSGELLVVARFDGHSVVKPVTVNGETIVRLELDAPTPKETTEELGRILADRFSADASKRKTAKTMLAEIPWEEMIRDIAWKAYRKAPSHRPLRREFRALKVSTEDRTAPYVWRHVGEKPAGGWGLVIAMHGGGGVPKEFNDEQWRMMFRRYRNHPEAGGGYVYLSLRAPNDNWNGFYDDAIGPMIERLIRQFVLFEDVNPDRVYALGASHGGYGAFVIGPKIPDRFAAVHASAAAPTDGVTRIENLRDLRFTVMVGEQDTAYGRADRCRKFAKAIEEMKTRYGGFPGGVKILSGVGHQVPDHDILAEMMKVNRQPWPDRVVWDLSDSRLKFSYWVEVLHPDAHGRIDAIAKDNTITLKTEHVDAVDLWLDPAIVDLKRPITIDRDGHQTTTTVQPSPETYCEALELRADPRLAAPARFTSEPAK